MYFLSEQEACCPLASADTDCWLESFLTCALDFFITSLPAARGDLGKVQDMFYFLLAAICIISSSELASFRLPKKSLLCDTVIILENLNNFPFDSKLLFRTAHNM